MPKALGIITSSPVRSANETHPSCVGCGLWGGCRTPWMLPFVPKGWTGEYLLVGEAPGKDEDTNSGRPFTGASGQLLRKLMRSICLDNQRVAMVNSVRCRPPKNRTPKMKEIRACRPFLLDVIERLRPQYVVGLGDVARKALLNAGSGTLRDVRGKLWSIPGLAEVRPSVWFTYHPSAVLRGASHLADVISHDLGRDWTSVVLPPVVGLPNDSVVGLDIEFSKSGRMLTAAVADQTRSFVVDEEDMP